MDIEVGITGNLRIALEVLALLAVTYLSAKVFAKLMQKSLKKMSKRMHVDLTQFLLFQRLIILFIYIVGLAIAGTRIPGMSAVWVSLFASAGILAVVVGFAAQATFSNIIAGVFIAMFEPFKVGDKITILNEYGTVEDITLRHTVVRTWDEKRVIIPNAKMGDESIINYSFKNPRILGSFDVGISYDSDIDLARKIMVEEAFAHPSLLQNVRGGDNSFLKKEELVKVRLVELADSSQKLRLYYWASDQTAATLMKFDLLESIKKRFDAEGVEIPFPHRTIVYRKDLEKPRKLKPAPNK
ncbi:MAG TPA: mechanosensitive ion channel family protein [Candidatus Altiarchaeales archaeon]|nr:mechanosensitive ion channel family protein [Candidatus Altiarchaeales archaeon]